MKKKNIIVSLILALCLCLAMAVPAFAAETDTVVDFSQFDWESYNKQALLDIEEDIDSLYKEVEEYKAQAIVPYGVSYGGVSYLDGDIFVSKDSPTGHAAMLVGSKILEIHPEHGNRLPHFISVADWYNRYNSTVVIRYKNDRTIPVNAAWYGQEFYINGEGSNRDYQLFPPPSLNSTTKEYCSGLVWKCYRHGANFLFTIAKEADGEIYYVSPTVISPLDFIRYRSHNGFSAIHIQNWTEEL